MVFDASRAKRWEKPAEVMTPRATAKAKSAFRARLARAKCCRVSGVSAANAWQARKPAIPAHIADATHSQFDTFCKFQIYQMIINGRSGRKSTGWRSPAPSKVSLNT